MTLPKWQYNEPDHPGFDFDAMAESYDQSMQKYRDIAGEIQEILGYLDLKRDQTVLEIGCGTGEFALAASGCCARIYAVDLSAGMLRYAQEKAKVRGVHNVSFLQGGFLTYQHQGAPLDAAVTQIALHHLPDFWKQVALIRVAGMLKEGGKLCLRDVVYSFDPREYESFFEECMSWARETMDSEFAGRIAAHVRAEYSTMDWIMEGLIERAGFKIEKANYKNGMFALYLCRKEGA